MGKQLNKNIMQIPEGRSLQQKQMKDAPQESHLLGVMGLEAPTWARNARNRCQAEVQALCARLLPTPCFAEYIDIPLPSLHHGSRKGPTPS